MRRWLREVHKALVATTYSQIELLHVNEVLRQAGEYTGDTAADVQRILMERYELQIREASRQ